MALAREEHLETIKSINFLGPQEPHFETVKIINFLSYQEAHLKQLH